MGRRDEALAERKLSVELDPVSPIVNFEYGMAFYYAQELDRAINNFEEPWNWIQTSRRRSNFSRLP